MGYVMRIAVLVIGLVLSIGLFLQSLTAAAGGSLSNDSSMSGAGGAGVLLAFIWIIACALVIPVPRVSVVLFLIGSAIGIGVGASTVFQDLIVWGVVSFFLAVFSYFGFRGKRKQQAKETARDLQVQESLMAQQQMAAHMANMQQQLAFQQSQRSANE